MRSLLVLLLCLVIINSSCKKDCPEPVTLVAGCVPNLQAGLRAYYPFSGNANDASGNGNNGTPTNGAFFTTDYLGRPNRAAGFDGVNDYVLVNDNGNLNVDQATISMMILVNNTNRRHAFVNRVNFSNATAVSYGIGQSLDVTNKFDFAVTNSSCTQPYVFSVSNVISTPETMIANRWYHVLVSFASGVQKIYIDGVLRGTMNRPFTTLNKCAGSQLVIGGWWQNDIISIDGKIDELRFYNRILEDCEIEKLVEIFQ
jgi:hypothetical protein